MRLKQSDPNFEAEFSALLSMKREVSEDVNATVAELLAELEG